MLKPLLGIVAAVVGPAAAATFSVTPLDEGTGGQSIVDALGFSGADRVDYVGATDQAGLFSNLLVNGAQGTSMSLAGGVMMTSGSVVDLPAVNDSGWYSNVTEGDTGSKAIKKIVPSTSTSRGGVGSHDANELSFRFDAPVNGAGLAATAMTVRFVFASEGFPEGSGTIFSDGFAFYVKSETRGSGLGTNYATFPGGEPVSLLSTAGNWYLLPNGGRGQGAQPGTGLPQIASLPYDGFTRVIELSAPLDERDNRVIIALSDTGDQIYDSAVFIAPIEFHYGGDVTVGARLTARSLAYVAMQAVLEPAQWALLLAGLGCVVATQGRRRAAR